MSESDIAHWRVLGLCGSLRARSANRAALGAAQVLAPPGMQLDLYEGMGELPLFNPDRELAPLPAPVAALRAAVDRCDALLIACPEYAHGVPGPFKNLLDWLVGGVEFPGKPTLLLNTSARDSRHAQAALREILGTMSARWLGQGELSVPLSGAGCEARDVLATAARVIELQAALAALDAGLRAIAATSRLA